MKVLVLDDDPEIVRVISRVVEYLGHEVVTETDPVIALVSHQDVDVLLVDFSMPRLNGLQVCETFALQQPNVLRVLLTAVPNIEEVRDALQSGLIHVLLTKPPTISEIEDAFLQVDKTFVGKA